MIVLSEERLIQWTWFLSIGIIFYFLVSHLIRNYLKSYNIIRTPYAYVSYTITPTIFLIIIPMDLFFLFYGQDIVFLRIPVAIESMILSIGSFFYIYVGIEGIISITYHPINRNYIHIMYLMIISALGSSLVLLFGFLNHKLLEALPMLGIFVAIGISITRINMKYNPLRAIVLHIATVFLSVFYIIIFFQTYG